MTRSERARRAAGLDGMRGVASVLVFLVHIWIYTSPSRPPRDDFWDLLIFEWRLCVVFFFVLSGFLLFRDFARAVVRRDGGADARGYAVRRVARIAPAYYVALTGAVLLLWGSEVEGFRSIDLPDLGLFALFAQNYSEATQLRFNPVLWTLALEVAFYISLPFIGMLAYRLGSVRRTALMLGSLVAGGIGWNAYVHYSEAGSVAAYLLPGYLPYFALGMLLSLALERYSAREGGWPQLGLGPATALMLSGFTLVVLDGWWHAAEREPAANAAIGVFQDLPAGFGFTAMIAAAAFGIGAAVEWTRLRPFVWMGEISYGFYLWHVPIILFTKRLDLLPTNFFAATAVTLPVAIAVAGMSWHLMERPIIQRAARRYKARRTEPERTALEARTPP